MASILYKFRSATNFETLPLPGTQARLFDVKRAIVRAKKLDRTSAQGPGLEFDLSIRNANTNEEYTDESILLPRGTRVVVQRMPAARGHGLLARIARADAGGGTAPLGAGGYQAKAGFYEIAAGGRDDDEFVSSSAPPPPAPGPVNEESELAALRAVTDQAGVNAHGSITTSSGPGKAGFSAPPAGSGGPPRGGPGGGPGGGFRPPPAGRPNADPELREAERRDQLANQPKKTGRGIPRTFLSLTQPPITDGGGAAEGEEGEGAGDLGSTLQPNAIGFEALLSRGGGASASGPGSAKRRDLQYALDLTATTVPDHLRCGICTKVVNNAMLVPWDPEGRTTCETCIRDGLTQNMFRCPLTGIEGASPDDLMPNIGLRKAAELFVQGVMDKMDDVLQEQEREEEEERKRREAEEAAGKTSGVGKNEPSAGDGIDDDRGAVLTKRSPAKKGRSHDADLFGEGGDDDFGGDVFDVDEEGDENDETDIPVEGGEVGVEANGKVTGAEGKAMASPDKLNSAANANKPIDDGAEEGAEIATKPENENKRVAESGEWKKNARSPPGEGDPSRGSEKKRAVPMGYQMGPASSGVSPSSRGGHPGHGPSGGRGGGGDWNQGGPGWGGRPGREDWHYGGG